MNRFLSRSMLITIGVLAVVVAAGLVVAWRYATAPNVTIRVPVISGEGGARAISRAAGNEALLAEARAKGDLVGCGDAVAYVPEVVPAGTDAITAAYEALFTGNAIVAGTPYTNPLSVHIRSQAVTDAGLEESQSEPLRFDRVEVEKGVASVYLTGEYDGADMCEAPRVMAVLTFAAKRQDPSIQEVKVLLNGEPVDFERSTE